MNFYYKLVFVLCCVEGKFYREISDILGVFVSIVEKYIVVVFIVIRNKVCD